MESPVEIPFGGEDGQNYKANSIPPLTHDRTDPETNLETNTGTHRSGSRSGSSPMNFLNRRRRTHTSDESGGSAGGGDDDDDSTKKKRRAAALAWCCRLPILLILLLLLLSAVVVAVLIIVKRPPADSDKMIIDGEFNKPSPSPTDAPLLKACVCYPWVNENADGSSIVYNIGGIEYKCFEDQLTTDMAQSTNLNICIWMQDVHGYTFKKNDAGTTSESVDVTTTGELSTPNLNQYVEATSVTITGSLSTSNLDTSSLDATQMEEVMDYFEAAITEELALPPGSTITITSLVDGIVEYEIVTYGDTSVEANTDASSFHTTLSDALTLDSISNTVLTLSEVSPNPVIVDSLASITVDSHTIGTTTEETTSKVTTSGELSVDNFDPSQFDTATQVEEAMEIFEVAITQELTNQGLLPEGSSVVVTGIADDGTVQYEVVFYGGTSEETSTAITNIGVSLSDASTLASISEMVQTESSSSSVSSALSSASITENFQTGTTGLIMTAAEEEEAKGYFEDAIAASLGSILPPGSTVTVASIKDGVLSYEISMNVSSSDEAEATVSAIEASLSTPSTLQEIASSVTSAYSNISVTVPGSLIVPNLNQYVEATSVSITGSLSTSNLDTSSLDATQMEEVMDYFEAAITEELALPPGSTITITSLVDGIVEYEIVTYGDTSVEANTDASSFHTTLSDALTLDSISNTVLTLSEVSPNPVIVDSLASITVDSHTIGTTTEETTSKVTTSGELSVDNFDPSQFDTATQVEEAMEIFEVAITQELTNQGLLPEGSSVVVTGIADDGTVQYEVVFYGGTSEETSTAITNIGVSLSDASTLASISEMVQTESSSSSVSSALSSASITENFQTGTTGLIMTAAEEEEAKGYFEDAIAASLGSILPPGSTVTVASIKDGVLSYEISMNVSSSDEAEATVSAIEASLSTPSTLQEIASSVVSDLSGGSTSANLINATSGLTVDSNNVVFIADFSPFDNSLVVVVQDNTPGTSSMSFVESIVAEVTFNEITMEISSSEDGASLITHDLSDPSFINTTLDSSGTSMTFSLTKPIAEFQEGIDLANDIEICSILPLEPNQLDRPAVEGLTTDGTQLLRPGKRTRELQQQQQQQQQLSLTADVCVSVRVDEAPASSTGLQV